MVRSHWMGPVFGVLALAGLARAQTTPPPPAAAAAAAMKERFITVQEPGQPPQHCKVLKMWTEADGTPAFQAQALDTGELITIEEAESRGPRPAGPVRSASMRIFHWGVGRPLPAGTPEPPADAVVVGYPTTAEPPHAVADAAKPSGPPSKWPTAYTQAKADEAHAAPAPVAQKSETTPAPHVPAAAPSPATQVAQKPESTPFTPHGTAAAPGTAANASPYAIQPAAGVPAKGLEGKSALAPKVWTSPAPTAWAQPATKPGPAKDTIIITRIETYTLPPGATAPTVVPPAVAATAAPTLAQPGDWRQSWGQATVAAAAPKADLPHAAAKPDDPLKSPEKYVRVSKDGASDKAKPAAPLPAALALQQTTTVGKADAKTADKPAPPAPPKPEAKAEAKPEAKQAAPATKAETKPDLKASAPAAPPAPAKPAVPLGMASAAAAQSPELAPAAVQAATSLKADEPNAFTGGPSAAAVASAPNAFSAPAPPPAAPPPGALAMNAFPVQQSTPAYLPPAAPARPAAAPAVLPASAQAAVGYVVPADGRPAAAGDLASLSATLRTSLFPSQREWAAESLGTMDWRHHPGVVDVLVERAKEDPAPGVRAECLRSLGRMKVDGVAAVQCVKACQSDSDDHVRQAAVEAYAEMTAATRGH